MKKITILFSVLILASCSKNENCDEVKTAAPVSEVNNLRDYLNTNGITTTEDSRGFFYTINSPGTGDKPTTCSSVTVNYIGKLLDGTTFDSGNNSSFFLSGLITGWQEGIPLIAPGGKITLYLPPTLAYGSSGVGSIPANSNLIFEIDLVKVN